MAFSLNSCHLAFLALYLFLLPNLGANGTPLAARQHSVTTFQTVHTTQTPSGPLTQTCVITLTPTTNADGQQVVVEVRECTVALSPAVGSSGSASNSGTSTVSVTPLTVSTTGQGTPAISANGATTTSTPIPLATSITPSITPSGPPSIPSFLSTVVPATISLPTSVPQSSSLSGQGVVINGLSTVSGPLAPTGSPAVGGITTTTTTTGPATTAPTPVLPIATSLSGSVSQSSSLAGPGIVVNGLSTVSGAPAATGSPGSTTGPATTVPTPVFPTTPPSLSSTLTTSSSSASTTSDVQETSLFQLPGKKLSVLPIGLGVFAGISVIALIVVGLVTYERTKYRKAFRQRKLAESRGGYGGLA